MAAEYAPALLVPPRLLPTARHAYGAVWVCPGPSKPSPKCPGRLCVDIRARSGSGDLHLEVRDQRSPTPGTRNECVPTFSCARSATGVTTRCLSADERCLRVRLPCCMSSMARSDAFISIEPSVRVEITREASPMHRNVAPVCLQVPGVVRECSCTLRLCSMLSNNGFPGRGDGSVSGHTGCRARAVSRSSECMRMGPVLSKYTRSAQVLQYVDKLAVGRELRGTARCGSWEASTGDPPRRREPGLIEVEGEDSVSTFTESLAADG